MSSNFDYDQREDSNDGFALGLLVGAAIGVVGAMLFAPKSGVETRQQLKDLADQQKDKLKNQWEETKAKAADVAGAAKEKLNSIAGQTKDSVDGYADKAHDIVDDLAGETKSATDKFQDRY
jgi:gas vesicle protein